MFCFGPLSCLLFLINLDLFSLLSAGIGSPQCCIKNILEGVWFPLSFLLFLILGYFNTPFSMLFYCLCCNTIFFIHNKVQRNVIKIWKEKKKKDDEASWHYPRHAVINCQNRVCTPTRAVQIHLKWYRTKSESLKETDFDILKL